ncbi:MAG: TIM barrel protein [Candidatus Woesearchaeota archaeon]
MIICLTSKNNIIFGTAGNIEKDILSSIRRLRSLGIGAQEVEFVRGVTMSNETAKKAGYLAKELGIRLSIHAPYYINLASDEKLKVEASKKRILDSCERGFYLGVKNVVFHAAFYGKRNKEEVYEIVKRSILEMQDYLDKKGFGSVKLSPETTGKKTQFGSLDELLKLRKDTKCSICVDFAHLLARDGHVSYPEIFKKIDENEIKELHCHFSGIEYGEKGERKHLITTEEEISKLLDEARKHAVDLIIINESPDPLGDTQKSVKIWEKMRI